MRNSFLRVCILLCTCGCASCLLTKPYTMTTFKGQRYIDDLHIVEIDSNRIVQECYFMNASDENYWRHQYILSMLNDKNEVISAFFPTNQDIDSCMKHLKRVDKIIKSEQRVRLCVRDELTVRDDNSAELDLYDFGPLGKHTTPYQALTFDTICNSKACVSISDTWVHTCPGFEHKK